MTAETDFERGAKAMRARYLHEMDAYVRVAAARAAWYSEESTRDPVTAAENRHKADAIRVIRREIAELPVPYEPRPSRATGDGDGDG